MPCSAGSLFSAVRSACPGFLLQRYVLPCPSTVKIAFHGLVLSRTALSWYTVLPAPGVARGLSFGKAVPYTGTTAVVLLLAVVLFALFALFVLFVYSETVFFITKGVALKSQCTIPVRMHL